MKQEHITDADALVGEMHLRCFDLPERSPPSGKSGDYIAIEVRIQMSKRLACDQSLGELLDEGPHVRAFLPHTVADVAVSLLCARREVDR